MRKWFADFRNWLSGSSSGSITVGMTRPERNRVARELQALKSAPYPEDAFERLQVGPPEVLSTTNPFPGGFTNRREEDLGKY